MSAFFSPLFQPLVEWTPKGLYCALGDFYIDPHRAVDTAIVTHAHSDHARRGSRHYLCAQTSVNLMRSRLGEKISVEGVPFGKRFRLGEVDVSLHPAGHILGSAQVRIEARGEVWVVSGDYKREPDPSCEPFEVVACDTFVTEATFGTPKYLWPTRIEGEIGREIHAWWRNNADAGFNSVVFGYSLGKAQRILAELASFPEFTAQPILIHDSIAELTECYRTEGVAVAATRTLSTHAGALEGALVLAPPSILQGHEWTQRLGRYRTAFASGWMQGGGGRPDHRSYDHGFVMSDHADWAALNRTIDETGAKRVFVLHRGNGALIRHLRGRGLEAHAVDTLSAEHYTRVGGTNLSLL